MPVETVKRPDGAALRILIDGRGRDLMLITGLSGAAGFWDPVVPALAEHFRVIRLDQRGIGDSSAGSKATDIDVLAADCFAVLDAADSKCACVLGHSMGGVIAQAMALSSPQRISGLVLSGTWARPSTYMRELFRSRAALLHKLPQEYAAMMAFLGYPPDWLDQHWKSFKTMLEMAPRSAATVKTMTERIDALTRFDRSADLKSITIPTLIQGAEDDLIVPAFLQRELQHLMPGAALAMLPNGGHFFPVTRPDGFLRSVHTHAERVGWTKA